MTGRSMHPDDPMHRSGAVWCDQHDQWECAKNSKRSGVRCHAPAIRGTATCRMHPGKSTALAKAQGEANLLAWSTQAAAEEKPMDLGRVVMDQLRVAVLRADLYGELLRLQVVAGEQLDEETGELVDDADAGLDSSGLVAPTYTIGREGQRYQTGEQVRGLAKLEAEWRDRAVRFAKTAHDMGIDERAIELEQAKAEQVVAAVRVGLEAIELDGAARERFIGAFVGALRRADQPVAGEVVD